MTRMGDSATAYFFFGVLATAFTMALPPSFPSASISIWRLILTGIFLVAFVYGAYLLFAHSHPQKAWATLTMAIGIMVFLLGAIWYRTVRDPNAEVSTSAGSQPSIPPAVTISPAPAPASNSTSRNQSGGVTSSGSVTSNNQSGGQTANTIINQLPSPPTTDSPQVQLLKRAVKAVQGSNDFEANSLRRNMETSARITWHNSMPGVSQESKDSYTDHALASMNQENLRLYTQVYRQEFMEVRRLLIYEVPNAARANVDYDDPRGLDLRDLTEAYLNLLISRGEITPEKGREYWLSMRPKLPNAPGAQ